MLILGSGHIDLNTLGFIINLFLEYKRFKYKLNILIKELLVG